MEILITDSKGGLWNVPEKEMDRYEKIEKLLGNTRLSKVELKDEEIDAQLVIFRPFYGWKNEAKENIFSELWKYIKEYSEDPVESISFYTFGSYGDSGSDLLNIDIPDDIKSKICVLTCKCTHNSNKSIYRNGGIALDDKKYGIPFSQIRRISCKDSYATDRIARFLIGDREHWPLKWSRVNRHPFYIEKMNWV